MDPNPGPANGSAGAVLALASSMAIAGSSVVVAKIIVADLPIFLANELRFGIAAAILVPAYVLTNGGISRVSRRDSAILVGQALTGVFAFNVLLFYGVQFTSAIEAGIITSTAPALVAVLAIVFLNDRPTKATIAGTLLAILGVVALEVFGGTASSSHGPNPLLGNALILGAVFGEALFTILGKTVSDRVSPLEIATAASVLGVAFFFPFALYELTWFDPRTVNVTAWLPVVYYGVVVTVVAFVLWFHGLATVPASTAGVFTAVLPVSAAVLSIVLLDEPFGLSHGVGILFVLGAVVLTSRGLRNGSSS
ncbi:DMT family transporter [Natrarchaeobius sp. A-rgal3]|uniref:DMT family transporter n=1 Tax=Natrarchaeobius versutus TaxID=1679078 RepID=UPI0035106D81